MIILENINKTFYTSEVETRALEDINLTVEKGEFVAIMGPSGCGKSTMLNIMGLLDKPTSLCMIGIWRGFVTRNWGLFSRVSI